MTQDDLFQDNTLLRHAQARFYNEIEMPGGTHCPCCGRYAKRYKRTFNSGMAQTLIWLYQNTKNDGHFIHLPTKAPREVLTNNQVSKLEFWGMVQRRPNKDDPTKHQSGYWATTAYGSDFVKGRRTANKACFEFNQVVSGWDYTQVTLVDALGKKFDYEELMRATN